MLRKKDCCGCGDWKSQIRELWMKYQSVVKGIKAGSDTVYPDGDGIADIDGAIENEVARQISAESLVTESDLSEAIADFTTVDQLDTGLATVAAAKQDKLVNQVNIKSINGVSMLGSGDVPIITTWDDVRNKPQFADVATSGSYDDLTDKPTIPAAQVNADWNAASGVAQILNKPTLAAVATSGDYDDLENKPTIPAAQVNSDWNASSGVAQILNKPTLATVATTGDYDDLTDKPTIPSGADLVPSTSGVTDGYVLTNDNGTPAWKAGGGGGGGGITAHSYATWGALATDVIAHPQGILVNNIEPNRYMKLLGVKAIETASISIRVSYETAYIQGKADQGIQTSSTATNLSCGFTGVQFNFDNNTLSEWTATINYAITNVRYFY